MNFDDARLIVLYTLAHELLLEHLEMVECDEDLEPDLDVYTDTVYETTVDRNIFSYMFDFTEEEVDIACENHWAAFVDPNVV